ncbi:lysozyme inhibitor LprI family protein [Sphingomonas sp. 3P27F8]|uniref:lysozyme inhibitor LprI family protein n=1 Tax=Sphingomonas sp. 3P27F8 TaxID=2502213 RepID=UPI0010F56365|nr:lysozyme inhibitor LprI family protein [Sphingomonas sp. 3P27F8]
MKKVRAGGALIAAAMLASCGREPVDCTSEAAQASVVGLVKEQFEKNSVENLKNKDGEEGAPQVGLSKIRAVISALVVNLEDIRTSKEDPNSTKKFCTASLVVGFTPRLISDADKARDASGFSSVSELASVNNVEHVGNKFKSVIDFNVQPTDDGKKVFAEVETGKEMFNFVSSVISYGLALTSIENAKRQEDEQTRAQAEAQSSALAEQHNASLEAAKAENQLAVQTIAAAWKGIGSETRVRILPAQKAWIRKKDADCGVESASAAVDPVERETARLVCDTRTTRDRINWLGQFRDGAAATTDIPQ